MKTAKALRAALLVSAVSPIAAHAADPAPAEQPLPQSTEGDQDVDQGAISYLETVSPKLKLSLDTLFRKSGWAIDLLGYRSARNAL